MLRVGKEYNKTWLTVEQEKVVDMNDVLVCPYCNKEQYTHEDDDISADMCLTECEHCHKNFWYSVEVTRTYYPYKDEV